MQNWFVCCCLQRDCGIWSRFYQTSSSFSFIVDNILFLPQMLFLIISIFLWLDFWIKWKKKKKPWFPSFPCIIILLLHLWSHIECANKKKTCHRPTKWIPFRDHCFARMLCLCFYLNYKLNLNVIVCVLGCCLLSVLHIQMLPLTMFLVPMFL